jgi:hypothetical protein
MLIIWRRVNIETGENKMKLFPQKYIRHQLFTLVISLLLIFFGACTYVQHQASINKNYFPKEDVRIKVAKVVNDTGYTFDVDIEQLLANTLEQQLIEEKLLNLGNTEPNLFLESRIIGYKKGSAFKRWLIPGWGATELAIQCDLKDDKNNLVGTAMSSREITGGGFTTVGAWETIFNDVANDVAGDLKVQIEAQGYVVKSQTQPLTTDQAQEAPKLASIPEAVTAPRISLRKEPLMILSEMTIKEMLLEYNFFDKSRNFNGTFDNDLVDNNDGTVTDRATGLMWQRGGSSSSLENRGAKKYIKKLNKQRFAGFSDWRMPTVEELASLLETRRKDGVHIASVFDNKQTRCWTADKCESQGWSWNKGTLLVDFKNGGVRQADWSAWRHEKGPENYVKAVRSVK